MSAPAIGTGSAKRSRPRFERAQIRGIFFGAITLSGFGRWSWCSGRVGSWSWKAS